VTRTMTKTDEEIANDYNESEDLSGFSGESEPVEVRRNVTISVRFSASEIESLRAKAEEAGTKVTAFIRAAALGAHRPPPDLTALAEATAAIEAQLHHLRDSLVAAEEPSQRGGKFELYQDKAGKYRFRLRAGNGAIVAVGEAYESKQAAEAAIESMQRAAGHASIVDA
jgi:uncharacterized protein YegP (UPF0339 family)